MQCVLLLCFCCVASCHQRIDRYGHTLSVVAVRLRPLHKNAGDSPGTTASSRPKPSLLYLPRRNSHNNKTSSTSSSQPLLPNTSHSTAATSNTNTTDDGCSTSTACKSSAWTIVNKDTLVLKGPGRKTPNKNQFTVDHVFDETMDTRAIYAEMGRPIIKSALTGRHGTLFAYGQTGSGKTFTLQGNTVATDTTTTTSAAAGEGLIQLAMSDLFHAIDASTSRDWEVKVQYFEIYNEEVHDLLAATPPESSLRNSGRTRGLAPLSSWTNGRSSRGGKNRHPSPVPSSSAASSSRTQVRLPTLKILEDGNGTAHVNALEKGVTSADECVRLLRKGNRTRAMAATDSNEHSSRSHAIFRVSLQSRPKQKPAQRPLQPHDTSTSRNHGGGGANLSLSSSSQPPPPPMPQLNEPTITTAAATRWSVLNFVDLAGSENGGRALGAAAASSNAGYGYSHHNDKNNKSTLVRRQREGAKINQSLLSLSRVIYSLSLDEDKRPAHIGYRDSKLTRILQPSLSGNAAMAILCCASLTKADITETRSTLKFATSAKQITIQPMVNEVLLHDPTSMAAAAAAAAVATNSMVLVAEKDAAVSRLQKELVTVKQTLREFQEQFQVFHDFSSSLHQQKEELPPLPPPVLFSKPLVVGRIMEVASGGDTPSMGSSEETLTFSPPYGQAVADKGTDQQEQPREQPPKPDGIVIVRTPASPSPLSPPLLPRLQQQNDNSMAVATTGTTPPRGGTADDDDDDNNKMGPPPPLTEVEISPQPTTSNNPNDKNSQLIVSDHAMALDEQRANYLEERIEMTESLVENIYSELNLTRRTMLEATARNAELHKQVVRLQRHIARILGHGAEEDDDEQDEDDGDDSLGRSIKSVLGIRTGERGPMIISGWYFLVCIILYAFGLRDLFLSAIIFLWLSLQMVK